MCDRRGEPGDRAVCCGNSYAGLRTAIISAAPPTAISATGEPQDEREHFLKCPACGRWIDMRLLDDVLDHERACNGTPAPPPN
jgi:hypothetical protein